MGVKLPLRLKAEINYFGPVFLKIIFVMDDIFDVCYAYFLVRLLHLISLLLLIFLDGNGVKNSVSWLDDLHKITVFSVIA